MKLILSATPNRVETLKRPSEVVRTDQSLLTMMALNYNLCAPLYTVMNCMHILRLASWTIKLRW